MNHYEMLKDADAPRRVRVRYALRLVSVIGSFVYGFLWLSVSAMVMTFLMLLVGPALGWLGAFVVAAICFGLFMAYPIRVALRFVKARRLIREGMFVTAVVENVREFRAGRGLFRATGTSVALRLPKDVGFGRLSFVLDGPASGLSAGETVPVLMIPGSNFCAAFPGETDLYPAGEAQSWLMRVRYG